jgi:hypothetical protein
MLVYFYVVYCDIAIYKLFIILPNYNIMYFYLLVLTLLVNRYVSTFNYHPPRLIAQ